MKRLIAGVGTLLAGFCGAEAVAQLSLPQVDYSGLAATTSTDALDQLPQSEWRPLAVPTAPAKAFSSRDRHAAGEARTPDRVLLGQTEAGEAIYIVDESGNRIGGGEVNCFIAPGGRSGVRAVDRSLEGEIGSTFALDDAPAPCARPRLGVMARGPVPQGDLQFLVAPATQRCLDGRCDVRGVKGEIRLGSDNGRAGSAERGWYVYAGADGTLVLFDERPSDLGIDSLKRTVDVRDTFTMGDMETGIMVNRGDINLSLNYVRRRTTYENWESEFENNADYVGLKLSID